VAPADVASTVPESVRQMLEQQLERLSPRDQRVLEVGSVAGATFSAAAVAAGLTHEVVAVEDWCAGLARRRQWLEACGEQVWPDGTVAGQYRFTHALYQEVAYHRLPAARRAQLHRRIGEREEAGYGPQVRERAAALAMHFERGWDTQRAVRYRQYAGENALQRSAYPEALQHLTQGLALLATLPETPARHQHELDLLLALGWALSTTKGEGAPELEPVLTRAAALCQQLGEPPQRFEVLEWLCVFHFTRAEYQAAQAMAEQCLDLAQRQHDPALLMRAHGRLGQTLFNVGAFAPARTHLEEALALLDPCGLATRPTALGRIRDHGRRWLLQMGRVLCMLGYPDQAVQRGQEGLIIAHARAHPFVLVETLWMCALIQRSRREWQTVQAHAEAILALATEHGFARHMALGTFHRGMALAGQGQCAEGLAQMWQGLAAIQATGQAAGMPWYLASLAEAYGQVGQVDEGIHLLAEALALVDTTGERQIEAELHRLHGELLLRQAVPEAQTAEACFQRALDVSRCQQAKWWELRAATSLARLWQQQGKRAEAWELLAEIYGWFTEGFDTADLQDARALLEALAG
jgi:predicted ATPase